MLKEFWKEKQVSLQAAAAFIAICGIFLAIPEDPDPSVQLALMNIQLFWLLVAGFSIISIVITLFTFTLHIEKSLGEKKVFKVEAASQIVFLLSLFCLWNFGNYVWTAYREVFAENKWFWNMVGSLFGMLLLEGLLDKFRILKIFFWCTIGGGILYAALLFLGIRPLNAELGVLQFAEFALAIFCWAVTREILSAKKASVHF